VLVGHLADVFGRHRLERKIGVALGIQGRLQRLAVTGHHDFLQIVGLRRALGGRLRLVGEGCMPDERCLK
jgi:hypothetical protein